jgi:hypothetical protein
MELGDIEHPRETLEECKRHLDLLRALEDNPSWTLFCRYISDSAGHLEQAVLTRTIRLDETFEQEFRKGRASALRAIPAMLRQYCETLEDNIKRIVDLMRKDEEDAGPDHSFDYRVESAAFDGADAGNRAP